MIWIAGSLVIDTTLRDIQKREGGRPQLSPKVVELLLLLAEHGGQFVEREKIYRQLWGDRIVETSALNNLVFQARLALGDSQRNVLETVAKRGLVLHVGAVEAHRGKEQLTQNPTLDKVFGAAKSTTIGERISKHSPPVESPDDSTLGDSLKATTPVAIMGESRQATRAWSDRAARYFGTQWVHLGILAFVVISTALIFAFVWKYDQRKASSSSAQRDRTEQASSSSARRDRTEQASVLELDVALPGIARQLVPFWFGNRKISIRVVDTQQIEFTDFHSRARYSIDELLSVLLEKKLTNIALTAADENRDGMTSVNSWNVQELMRSDVRYIQIKSMLLQQVAYSPETTQAWQNLLKFLQFTEADRDASWLVHDTYFRKLRIEQDDSNLWNSPELTGEPTNEHSWSRMCSNSHIESFSWMRGNCHFRQAIDLFAAHQNSQASKEFALAHQIFSQQGDFERAEVADLLTRAMITQLDESAADFSRYSHFSSSELAVLMMSALERLNTKQAYEIALQQARDPRVRDNPLRRAQFARIAGRAALKLDLIEPKRFAIFLLESELNANPFSKLRSLSASTLMDVYSSLDEPLNALQARKKITHDLPLTFTCISALIANEALEIKAAKRDIELCKKVKDELPDFVSLSLVGEINELLILRLQKSALTMAEFQNLKMAWKSAPTDKPNWALATTLLFRQAFALKDLDWVDQQWNALNSAQKVVLDKRGYTTAEHDNWRAARSDPERISPNLWPIPADAATDSKNQIRKLFLATLKAQKCIQTQAEAENLAHGFRQRGALLAEGVVLQIARRCKDGSLFVKEADWPVFF